MGSDLNETGIFVFLTLVIFFGAVGFPTLINTSPTIGYDEITIAKLTPVTTFYQEAYAEQEAFGVLSSYYFDPILSSALLLMPNTLDFPPEDPLQYFERRYSEGIQLEFGFIEFDTIQEFFSENIDKTDYLPPQINKLLDFEVLPPAYGATSILFEDPFEIQPASNGWIETCTGCTGSSGIFFFSPSSTAFRIASTGAPFTIFGLERSLDTTGFSDVAFNLTAHQLGGTYEVADYLSFEVDYGNGTFITILQDVRHWSGVDNRITDPDPSGNGVPTSTGFVSMGSEADNNPDVKIRIEGVFNSQTISPPLEGYFIDHINFTASIIPPPSSTTPASITDLNATQTNSIFLNWTAPDDGGSPITGYEIDRARTDIARNGTYMDFLFREHEISGDINSGDPTDEVITSASEGFVGQALNVTSDEEVGAIAVSLHRITTVACSGSAFLQGTIFFDNGTRVGNSTNTFAVCDVDPNLPPRIDQDHVFIFNNTEIFSGNEYVFGVEKVGTNTDGDIDIPASADRTTLAKGFTARDFSSPPFTFTNDTLTDTAVSVFILNFTTLVADTGNTNTNFTDTSCPAGITCYYRAQGINAVGTAGKSNIVNATETGLETIFNSTSDVNNIWSYRVHDDEYSAGTAISGECADFPNLFQCGGIPDTQFETGAVSGFDQRPKMSVTFGTTANTGFPQGNAYFFKTFTKDAILNQDIKVFWELVEAGGNNRRMEIQVYDGAYIAENNEDFPYNNAIKIKGGGLLGVCATGAGGADKPVHFTECLDGIDGNDVFNDLDINYTISTEDYITVFLQQQPITLSRLDLYLNNMTITNVAFWDFINANLTNTRGAFNDTRVIEFDEEAGFYTANVTNLGGKPDPITDLQVRISNTTAIYSTGASGATQVFDKFPTIITQIAPTFTSPTLIDSIQIDIKETGATAFPVGTVKAVIIGDRTGDLTDGSLLSNIYFIENSTNTISTSLLPALAIFNFSGNTILDSNDSDVGIGIVIDSHDAEILMDLFGSGAFGKMIGTGADCAGDNLVFDDEACSGVATSDLSGLNIFGGNARAVLDWTAPPDNGLPITGYEINVVNTTEIGLYWEMYLGENNVVNKTEGDDTQGSIVLGNLTNPNGSIAGQRITFPNDVVITTLFVTMGSLTFTPDPLGDIQGVILKNAPNNTASFERVANSTNFRTPIKNFGAVNESWRYEGLSSNCCPQPFGFEPIVLTAGVEYIIGVEVVDLDSPATVFADFQDNNSGGNGVHVNNGLGIFTQLNTNINSKWFDNSTLELNAQMYGYNFTTLVSDTGNTDTDFTDSVTNYPSTNGKINARSYSIKAINSDGIANASNFIEISPDRDSFDTWQWRELDFRPQYNTDCDVTVDGNGFLNLVWNGTTQPNKFNRCAMWKSFDATEFNGSDVHIIINATGTFNDARKFTVTVLDGGYDKDNSGDFIKNQQGNLAMIDKGSGLNASPLNGIGTALNETSSKLTPISDGCIEVGGNKLVCDYIIPASSINYSDVVTNQITLRIGYGVSTSTVQSQVIVDTIEISNIGSWDFSNNPRIIDTIANGQACVNCDLPNLFSTLQNGGEDDRGIIVTNSVVNGSITIIPDPPEPITDLQVIISNTTAIYSSGASGATQVFDKFPTIITQITPTFTSPTLIDSIQIDIKETGATALPVGTVKAVIIGDRTGDLTDGSLLSDIYFIENSTNTISTSLLPALAIFNFSGNTILDSGDFDVGIGIVIDSHDAEILMDLFGSGAFGKMVGTGADCAGDNLVFDDEACSGVATSDLSGLNIFGGNARTILNWTTPADNGGAISGYEILIANATQQILFDEEVELDASCGIGDDGRCEDIGTGADPLGFAGQRITFATDVQLTDIMLNLVFKDLTPFGGSMNIQGVVLKDAPVGTGSFTRVANSTIVKVGDALFGDIVGGSARTFNTFNNKSPEAFSFNNTILTAGVEYIIGVETIGTFAGSDTFEISHNATANESAPNNGLGVFTKLHVGTSDLWVDNSTQNLNAMFIGLNYTTEVIDTGNTNTEYTSTANFPSTDEKINAYQYLVKAINSGGSANASNTAEISPDRTGFDLWDYRERDSRTFFSPQCDFGANDEGVFTMNFTGATSVGFCDLFKTFNKTEITGSDIGINVNFTENGRIFFNIVDGSYDKDTFADFPLNNGHPSAVLASAIKGIGTLNETDSFFIGTDQCDLTAGGAGSGLRQCNVVIPASGIDYVGSTEDEITVFLKLFAGNSAIGNIEISNVGSWDFTNSPRKVIGIDNGDSLTFSLGASNNQDDRGNVYSNGIFAGNVTVITNPPDQVTNLVISQNMNNNATLDWDDALNADNYQVFREFQNNGTFWIVESDHNVADPSSTTFTFGSGVDNVNANEFSGGRLGVGTYFKNFPTSFLNNTKITVERDMTVLDTTSGQLTFLKAHNFGFTLNNTAHFPLSDNFLIMPASGFSTYSNTTTILDAPFGGTSPKTFLSVDFITPTDINGFSSVFFGHQDGNEPSAEGGSKFYSLNITDIDTGATKIFYDFASANLTINVVNVAGIETGRGILQVSSGSITQTVEPELIGSPTISEFVDSTIPLKGISTYKVRGNNTDGFGLNSTEVEFGLIQPIRNLNATALNSTAVKLIWDQATTEHPSDPLTGVLIQSNATGSFVTITTVDELDVMYIDNGLTVDNTYSYRVKGQSAVSTGSFSENNTATTFSALNATQTEIDFVSVTEQTVLISPPFPITDLAGSTTGMVCSLTWTEPVTGGSPIIKYQIFRSINGQPYLFLVNTTFTNYTDAGLTNMVVYDYNVTSINAFGDSEASNIDDCQPVVADPPNEPTNLQLFEEPNGDVTLTWDEPTLGDPTGYRIERKIAQASFSILVNDTGTTSLTYLDIASDPATEYSYRVAGWNFAGLGDYGVEATITTSSPPNAPILSANQNGDKIDLSWVAPVSANPISGYKIDKRTNFGSFTTLIANTTNALTTFSDSNVTKPDTFGYRIFALSSAGQGDVSNVVDVVFGSHLVVHVREQDGSGFKGGGFMQGFNSTFSELVGLNGTSDAVFDNLPNLAFNFTFFDDDDFILNKTFNIVAPAGNDTSEFTINALVFDVDCPVNGVGTDVRIKVNYTDVKDITAFPSTPVCDSTDQVSWSTSWVGGAINDSSTMIADFISPTFKANAEQFLASADIIPTSYNSGENQIESDTYVVNMTSVTINFNLFLGKAPAGGGGGGSPPPSAQPTPTIPDPEIVFGQRLTGLNILSRTHQFAQAGDILEGSITVNWEGETNLSVRGIDTTVGDLNIQFDDGLPPFDLDQKIDGIGEFAMSTAEIRYKIQLPSQDCNAEIGITQNCFDPILHTLPIEFEFEREGQVYEASTEIFVDGRPIPIDIVQLQVILLFLVLIASAVFGNIIRKRFQKTTQRTKKVKTKFKKKFDSS